jgi:hypothetical protein
VGQTQREQHPISTVEATRESTDAPVEQRDSSVRKPFGDVYGFGRI